MVCWLLKVDEEITCLQKSVLLLNTGSIYLFSLYCYVFSLCCARFCYCRLVPSNFCYVWKLLPVHWEKSLWMLFYKDFPIFTDYPIFIYCYYLLKTGYKLILAEFLFLLRWCCLFLLKVLSFLFFLLLLYVYLLDVVGNLGWQTSVLSSSQ